MVLIFADESMKEVRVQKGVGDVNANARVDDERVSFFQITAVLDLNSHPFHLYTPRHGGSHW